jgi:sulfatase maturation enzyme AslB (radical SAM superfamily)
MQVKFKEKTVTAKGEPRAFVDLVEYNTIWFNTGTLCNLSCQNCYIESSPKNDLISFLTLDDVKPFLEEIKNLPSVKSIGFTGGEPFINPNFIAILTACLEADLECLVLTNGYKLLSKYKTDLLDLKEKHGKRLKLRISLDHYNKETHEEQRGENTFQPAVESLQWLAKEGFEVSIAGRALLTESKEKALSGYSKLIDLNSISMTMSESNTVLFPEMITGEDVPEITTACWGILNKSPTQQMCASERMILKRKGQSPVVVPCTLLAYDPEFELGSSLGNAEKKVYLNHEFCAKFCVLGDSSCSA